MWHQQGLAGIVGNPVLSQAIAGLATSATAQATLERVMLFDLKDKIIEPFGETAQQVFARISAMRDSLDGPQVCSLDTLLQRHICPCNEFVHLRWLLGCIHPCLGVQAYRRASMSPQSGIVCQQSSCFLTMSSQVPLCQQKIGVCL